MAKTNVENVRLRPDTFEENRTILREIKTRKEVDARKQDELNELFDRLNAECASRSLKEIKRKALISSDKQEKVVKTVHYGPLPGFSSGKWWGIRMDCSRDCVHEPFNENVHEGPFGAVSICTSHINNHNDIDLGDALTFTSQEYHPRDQSKESLILSYKNKVPIRLVRSYCLSNDYAPKTGYRYDGLYTVVDYWIGVTPDSQKHRKFALIRLLDQERPPWAEKVSTASKHLRMKKSMSPIRTRSHSNTKSKESKTKKFVYKKVQKESKVASVSAIVSRQVFKKFSPGSPDSSPKSTSSTDSTTQNSCPNSCPTKLCNTNLSIRTNLYDSSHKLQGVKKVPNITYCRTFQSKQSAQVTQKSSQEEIQKMSSKALNVEDTDEISSISVPAPDKCTEKKVKKVTWADSCSSTLSSIEKSFSTSGNGFQYSGSDVVDGFSPTSSRKGVLKFNNITENLSPINNSKSNGLFISNTTDSQHIAQVHSKTNAPHTSRANFSTMCEPLHETKKLDEPSSSIESLAPDKLVSVIVKEKYHPMAKLLIGNMIGSENQESAILSAYNTLTSKVEDESIKSKENKLRNKFYISNKSRKNGMLKKQRREIANLTIDAKFDTVTRGSSRSRRLRSIKKRISKSEMSQRKLMNARRIQSRNLTKEIRSTGRELQPKKLEKRKSEDAVATKRPKMVTVWTQCTILTAPTVDQSLQTSDSFIEETISETDMKVEVVDVDDIKSEPCDMESTSEETASELNTNFTERNFVSGSAFAAVNTVDSSVRIARLRSIGFRPIGTCSPMEEEDLSQESPRPEVDEEYNKYTSEENDVVGYMDEQLHYEDIEDEESDTTEKSDSQKTAKKQSEAQFSPQPVDTWPDEHDFNKPWHGWKKIVSNGQVYWTGY